MMSSTRVMVALFLIFFALGQEVQPKSPNPPVDLKPYLLRQEGHGVVPSNFQLDPVGDASHRLQFQFGATEAVELEISLGFPQGGARTLRRRLDPGPKESRVSFDLGPLLAHGPYRPLPASARKGPPKRGYLPTGWWMDTHDPGNYLLTVKGRRVQDGQIIFTTDSRSVSPKSRNRATFR